MFDKRLIGKVEALLAPGVHAIDEAEGLALIVEAQFQKHGASMTPGEIKYVKSVLHRAAELHKKILGKQLRRLGPDALRGYFSRHRTGKEKLEEPQ